MKFPQHNLKDSKLNVIATDGECIYFDTADALVGEIMEPA